MAVKTELSRDVGARLRAIREGKGIPREQLAIALRMGAENVRHYEAGRTPLTLPMLPVIADLYGMTLAELVADLFEPGGSCQDLAVSVHGRQNKSTANYNYTESANPPFAPIRGARTPSRELVSAGR